MTKTTLKALALTLAVYAYTNESAMADWHHDVFAGCLEEGAREQARCKDMCASKYEVIGGHATKKDLKLCPTSEGGLSSKPIACFCDYKD